MINRNTRHNEQEHKDKKRCTQNMQTKNRILFKSQFEKMEIAYNNNEARNLIKK